MIILLCVAGLVGALYCAMKLPSAVQTMTDEEYRQYFATYIMGIKL